MSYEPAFNDAVAFTLGAEGVLSDVAGDNGGLTKYGVTQAAWAASGRSGSVASITQAQAIDFYHEVFWKPLALLPNEVRSVAFDFAVNSGLLQAAKTLQGLLGTVEDGNIGPVTLGKFANYTTQALRKLRNDYITARIRFDLNLVEHNVNDVQFALGWFNRVVQLYDFAY